MRNDHSHPDPQTNLLRQLGYESQDVNAAGLLRWVAILGIFLTAMAVIAFAVYKLFIPTDKVAEVPATALNLPKQMPPPNYPLLQKDPRADIMVLRAYEAAQLDNYGWIDKKKQIVHIPIDQAIDLTVQDASKDLPVRTPQEEEQSKKE